MKNVKLATLVLAGAVVLCLASCSNPEASGIKVAKEFCDCEQDNLDALKKEYSGLVKKFPSYNFQTRVAVRKKVQEIDSIAKVQHAKCLGKAQETYKAVGRKHFTSKERAEKFEYAFRRTRELCEEDRGKSKNNALALQIDSLRLSIIPPKPDVEKIKRHLLAYTYNYGYYRLIEEKEIQELQIVSETKQGEDYVIEAYLTFPPKSRGKSEASVDMTYSLQNKDDWYLRSAKRR